MNNATLIKYSLNFASPAGTSRGILSNKPSWFVLLSDPKFPGKQGIGECSIIPGLSKDDPGSLETILLEACRRVETGQIPYLDNPAAFPAAAFALEMALIDLYSEEDKILFPSSFTQGTAAIPINGLIWMGTADQMKQQVGKKIEQGFDCLKLKIGALDFEEELKLLRFIREEYQSENISIRLDANGAFQTEDALEKLMRLSEYQIHSIEQPIKPRQWMAMAELCKYSPIPIALDEELIGLSDPKEKEEMLQIIQPAYLILKPSLLGGFAASEDWIRRAEKHGIAWWITSALESNIGLNAIAQWTYTIQSPLPQGLGTGSLYTNNIPSPLTIAKAHLRYDPSIEWDINILSK